MMKSTWVCHFKTGRRELWVICEWKFRGIQQCQKDLWTKSYKENEVRLKRRVFRTCQTTIRKLKRRHEENPFRNFEDRLKTRRPRLRNWANSK